MTNVNVLVVDDDKDLLRMVQKILEANGYTVTTALNPLDGIEKIETDSFDLILSDANMPYKSGFDFIKTIRSSSHSPDVAIALLTGRRDKKDVQLGLDCGADDYIIKPFSPILLLKRIEALLRRTIPEIKDNGLVVDESAYTVAYNKDDLGLTLTEFLIFSTMYNHPNIVYTRDMLLELIFEDDYLVNDRIIDAHIKNLRKKLPNNYIKTIIGLGYKYETKE